MPSFAQRSPDIEIMDDLRCAGEVVDQTLRELEIINRLLGGNYVTISGVKALLKTGSLTEVITIADLGCGGGDILKLVAQWGRKSNLRLQLTGIDANPNIIAFAEAHSQQFPGINYQALNIFTEEFRTKKFDLILATLFMHHFNEEELVSVFGSLHRQAKIGIVINDIHRHWFAFYSIRILTRLFSKSKMVKYDAPLSVLRAFKKSELQSILQKAGIETYELKWKWAFRWQLIIPTSLQ
jgi:2-polyprenyl-3-methyl-5-hydroxy-6-metoxy-1,4-benzoquinol methylase